MKKDEKRGRTYKTGTERAIRLSFRASEIERNNLDSLRVLLQNETGKSWSYADILATLTNEKLKQLQNQQL